MQWLGIKIFLSKAARWTWFSNKNIPSGKRVEWWLQKSSFTLVQQHQHFFFFYCPSAIRKVLFLISVLYMSWLVNNPQLLCYLTHWTIFAISWLRTYTKPSWLNLAALLLITYPASSCFQMAGCYNASPRSSLKARGWQWAAFPRSPAFCHPTGYHIHPERVHPQQWQENAFKGQ